MADKHEQSKEGMLVEAARKIGTVAGKIAAKTGATAPPHEAPHASPRSLSQQQKEAKPGRLAPKNKSRLPRKQKKALRKA